MNIAVVCTCGYQKFLLSNSCVNDILNSPSNQESLTWRLLEYFVKRGWWRWWLAEAAICYNVVTWWCDEDNVVNGLKRESGLKEVQVGKPYYGFCVINGNFVAITGYSKRPASKLIVAPKRSIVGRPKTACIDISSPRAKEIKNGSLLMWKEFLYLIRAVMEPCVLFSVLVLESRTTLSSFDQTCGYVCIQHILLQDVDIET